MAISEAASVDRLRSRVHRTSADPPTQRSPNAQPPSSRRRGAGAPVGKATPFATTIPAPPKSRGSAAAGAQAEAQAAKRVRALMAAMEKLEKQITSCHQLLAKQPNHQCKNMIEPLKKEWKSLFAQKQRAVALREAASQQAKGKKF